MLSFEILNLFLVRNFIKMYLCRDDVGRLVLQVPEVVGEG